MKIVQIVADNDLSDAGDIVFVQVMVTDPSDFESVIDAPGEVMHGEFRVITLESPACPTPWPRSSCTSATAPECARTSTSSETRATRCPTC